MTTRAREILSVRPDRVRHRVVLCTRCRASIDPCWTCRSHLRTIGELARWRRPTRPADAEALRALEAAWIAAHGR